MGVTMGKVGSINGEEEEKVSILLMLKIRKFCQEKSMNLT
jgi:hypothetical protein